MIRDLKHLAIIRLLQTKWHIWHEVPALQGFYVLLLNFSTKTLSFEVCWSRSNGSCADVTQETLNHQLDLCVASCPIYPMTIIKCLRQMVVQWKANSLWLYKKPDVGTITFWWLLSPAQVLMLKACLLSNWNEVIKTLIIENNSHLCLIMWSVAFAVEIPVHLCNVWFNFRVKIFIQSFIGLIYSISPR